MNRLNKLKQIYLMATIVAIILILLSCQTTKNSNMNKIMVVAHRGGAALKKENSLQAFSNAISLKVDAIELDVHLSADGVLIVHHDPLVKNENGKKIAIRELDAQYLTSLKIDEDQYIPTFEEVLVLLKESADYQVIMFVEIKVDDRNKRYLHIEEKVIDLLHEYDFLEAAYILSFDFPTLETIKKINNDLHTSALISKAYLSSVGAKGIDRVVEDMRNLKISSVGVKDIYLTQTMIDALHKIDIQVGVWTVNDEREMKKFQSMNVDFITSDNPILLERATRMN